MVPRRFVILRFDCTHIYTYIYIYIGGCSYSVFSLSVQMWMNVSWVGTAAPVNVPTLKAPMSVPVRKVMFCLVTGGHVKVSILFVLSIMCEYIHLHTCVICVCSCTVHVFISVWGVWVCGCVVEWVWGVGVGV